METILCLGKKRDPCGSDGCEEGQVVPCKVRLERTKETHGPVGAVNEAAEIQRQTVQSRSDLRVGAEMRCYAGKWSARRMNTTEQYCNRRAGRNLYA